MSIADDIRAATSDIGKITIKGELREIPKTSKLGIIKYTKRLEAMLNAILAVLDTKDAEIKTLSTELTDVKTDVVTVKEDVLTMKSATETKP